LVVKTAGSPSAPDVVGIMRKTAKGWEYEEFTIKAGNTVCSPSVVFRVSRSGQGRGFLVHPQLILEHHRLF
jgi:hypothetical protein